MAGGGSQDFVVMEVAKEIVAALIHSACTYLTLTLNLFMLTALMSIYGTKEGSG